MFDALVFEFLGLAMLGLCLVVIATPSRRAPGRPRAQGLISGVRGDAASRARG